jgi:hypothetical protein
MAKHAAEAVTTRRDNSRGLAMSNANQPHEPHARGAQHNALEIFIGDWKAEGLSFGGPNQDARNPRGNSSRWNSTHRAYWHTGRFFLIQDERAQVDGPFDTLSVMGWDDDARRYFSRTFANHGFYRHYDMTAEGNVWTISGRTERARIEFSGDGMRQSITWEWRPQDVWLPLCDRVATKV